MTVIHNSNAKILFYGPSRETCLGLIIPGEMREIPVSSMDISFALGGDVKYASIAALPDASVSFTGYFDKDDSNGEDPASSSGS